MRVFDSAQANKDLTLRSILAVVVWQGTPFYTMNFLAGLGIP